MRGVQPFSRAFECSRSVVHVGEWVSVNWNIQWASSAVTGSSAADVVIVNTCYLVHSTYRTKGTTFQWLARKPADSALG